MRERKVIPLTRKVLTLYGDRGFQQDNPGYTDGSVVRGYDNLNRYLEGILNKNPAAELLGMSYSHIVIPYGPNQSILRIFITVVYTGEFRDLDLLPTFSEDKDAPHMYLAGRGTMIRVQL